MIIVGNATNTTTLKIEAPALASQDRFQQAINVTSFPPSSQLRFQVMRCHENSCLLPKGSSKANLITECFSG